MSKAQTTIRAEGKFQMAKAMHSVLTGLFVAAVTAVAGCGGSTAPQTAALAAGGVPTPYPHAVARNEAVPKAVCQQGDQPETGLQGQIPVSDRMTGRAAQPYYCNLAEVGFFKGYSHAWAAMDFIQDKAGHQCSYYGVGIVGGGTQGVLVLPDEAVPNPLEKNAGIELVPQSVKGVSTGYVAPVVAGPMLVTPGMQDPWESLRINTKTGLMAAAPTWTNYLDVYDVSGNTTGTCLAPVFKASGTMSYAPVSGVGAAAAYPAKGHEGWFSPDGTVYYMSSLTTTGGVSPVDLTDPAKPTQISYFGSQTGFNYSIHGGWISDDASRAYLCATGPRDSGAAEDGDSDDPAAKNSAGTAANGYHKLANGPRFQNGNGILIVDNTQVRDRVPNPKNPAGAGAMAPGDSAQGANPTVTAGSPWVNKKGEAIAWPVVGFAPLPENSVCQSVYPVTYKGHPYLIAYGEGGSPEGTGSCGKVNDDTSAHIANWSIPTIIDIADETHPKTASLLPLEVSLPKNCNQINTQLEGGAPFTYGVHHCSPDRLHDPTILACSWFTSGERVFDIRDPYNPKEIAYYNVSQTAPAEIIQNIGTISRPLVITERGEIWFTNELTGFHIVKFEKDPKGQPIWPFPETPKCPEVSDYYFNQYNPNLGCK